MIESGKKIKYNMKYHEGKFGNWIKDKELYKLREIYAKRNYFNNYFNKDSKVLEFGCGIGQNISWIENSYGYDINKELYSSLKEKGIKMFESEKEIPNDFFDIIITSQTLEHVPNPTEIIKFLKKKLKKGGKLITVIPRLREDLKSYGLNKKDMNKTFDGHLFGWTFYEINCLLNYCGFTNIVNKKLYRRGIERLTFLNKFGLYFFGIELLGKFTDDFDIMIISKK